MNPVTIALALALATAQATPQATPQAAPSVRPDVAIFATVRARELRFEEVPDVEVRFRGNGETVWKTDRENLPDEVQPRVLYRDIGIRLTITSTLPNIEEILKEALEEEDP
jgi:hypothetical protein